MNLRSRTKTEAGESYLVLTLVCAPFFLSVVLWLFGVS